MQRRTFIKHTALCAVAVSASGFIRFNGNRYVGDCETTSDILGPFYRPGSPLRNNLLVKGDTGQVIELRGMIKHKDCQTPYRKAMIELWHCSSQGVYDNSSDKFLYRGTTYSDDKGQYTFKTILPVAYDAGGGNIRPAHFHMMVSAPGYQPLVTQLYFSGDPQIASDEYASSPTAKRRILTVQSLPNGNRKVLFDVSMSDTLAIEPAAIDQLTGIYTDLKNSKKKVEFFKSKNSLWMKNEVFGHQFEYTGNNTFHYKGLPPGEQWYLQFRIQKTGAVELTETSIDKKGQEEISKAVKEKH